MYMLRMIKIHVVQSIGWNLCRVTAGVTVSSGRKVAQCARLLATEIYIPMFHQSFILKSIICSCFNNNGCQLWQSKMGDILWKTFDIFHQYYPAVYSPAQNTNAGKMPKQCHLQRCLICYICGQTTTRKAYIHTVSTLDYISLNKIIIFLLIIIIIIKKLQKSTTFFYVNLVWLFTSVGRSCEKLSVADGQQLRHLRFYLNY